MVFSPLGSGEKVEKVNALAKRDGVVHRIARDRGEFDRFLEHT